MPDLNDTFLRLVEFNSSEWTGWITRLINGAPSEPGLSLGKDPAHEVLNAIYDQLPETSKAEFSAGLADLLPVAQVDNREVTLGNLFTLLQVSSHVAPPAARNFLFSRLTSEVLRGLTFAGWDLHTLLLVACSVYGVDLRLKEYVVRSAFAFEDFNYRLICFRVLTKLSDVTPYLLLEQIIGDLSLGSNYDRLAEVMNEAVERTGRWQLLRWLAEHEPRLAARSIAGMDRFNKLLREVVPWPTSPESAEPGLLLLAAWVHAPERQFTARDIESLLYVRHRTDPAESEKFISDVFTRIAAQDPWWDIVDGSDRENPRNQITGHGDFYRIITYSQDGGQRDEVQLTKSVFQQEVALLLAAVKSRATSRGVPAAKRRAHHSHSLAASHLARRSI
jgi:hypothetical protein